MSHQEEKSDISDKDIIESNMTSNNNESILESSQDNPMEIDPNLNSQNSEPNFEMIQKQLGETTNQVNSILQELNVQTFEEAIAKINSILSENQNLKNIDSKIIQSTEQTNSDNTEINQQTNQINPQVPYIIDNTVCFEDFRINIQDNNKNNAEQGKTRLNGGETDSGDENIDQFINDYIQKETTMDLTKIVTDDQDEIDSIDVEDDQIKKEKSSLEDLDQSTFTKAQIEHVYNQMQTLVAENAKLAEKVEQLEKEKQLNLSENNQNEITNENNEKGNKSFADIEYQMDLNERLAKTIEELEEANKNAYEEIDTLKQQNLELSTLNESLIQTNERLENEIQTIQSKHSELVQDDHQQEESSNELEILQTKIKQLENENAELQSKIDTLQQTNIDLDDQAEQLKSQINEMKNMKEQSSYISITKDNLQDRIAELENELSQLNQQKKELDETIEALKKWNIEKDAKINKLKEKKNSLKQQLNLAKAENDKLSQRITEINPIKPNNEDLEKLKMENEQLKSELLELQQKEPNEILIDDDSGSDPLKSDADTMENENLANEEVNAIKIHAEIIDNDFEDFKQKYEEIKKQFEQEQERCQNLEKENEKISNENKQLAEQSSHSQMEYEKLLTEHNDAIVELQSLKVELESLRSKEENDNKQTENTEFDVTELNSVDALNSDNEEIFEEEKLSATAPVITYLRDSFIYENPLNASRTSQILPSEQSQQKRESLIPPPSPTRKTTSSIQQRNLELENAYNEALEMQYQIVDYAKEKLLRLTDTYNDFLLMALARIEENEKALMKTKIKSESLVRINSTLVKACQALINSVWKEYQTTTPPLISRFANLSSISPQKSPLSKIQPSRISSRVYKNGPSSPNNNGETLLKIVNDAIKIQTVGLKSLRQKNKNLEDRLSKAQLEFNEERQSNLRVMQKMQRQQEILQEKQRTSTLTPQVEQLVHSFASDIKAITNKMVSNHAALFGGTKMNSFSTNSKNQGSNIINDAMTSSSNYLVSYQLHQNSNETSNDASQNDQFMVSFSSYTSNQKENSKAQPLQNSAPIVQSKKLEEKKLAFNPYATYFNKNMQQRLGPTHVKPNEEEIEEEEEDKDEQEEKYHYKFGF